MIACRYPSKLHQVCMLSLMHQCPLIATSQVESKKQKQVLRHFLDAYRHAGLKGMYHVTFTAMMHVIHQRSPG